MKINAIIPIIIALFVLVCSPFSYMPFCQPDLHGGLVCYCCSSPGKKCTMISCSCTGCRDKGDISNLPWTSEIILYAYDPTIHLKSLSTGTGSSQQPENAYLDVPVKPPNNTLIAH
jgi:hypothetical protein